jgi:ADP-ribosylation factor GTPase-activating protein 2/3
VVFNFQEEKLKQLDPKKAAQAERLGMGGLATKPGISHSVITEIASIEQVRFFYQK